MSGLTSNKVHLSSQCVLHVYTNASLNMCIYVNLPTGGRKKQVTDVKKITHTQAQVTIHIFNHSEELT